jgi:hypothetical protein
VIHPTDEDSVSAVVAPATTTEPSSPEPGTKTPVLVYDIRILFSGDEKDELQHTYDTKEEAKADLKEVMESCTENEEEAADVEMSDDGMVVSVWLHGRARRPDRLSIVERET